MGPWVLQGIYGVYNGHVGIVVRIRGFWGVGGGLGSGLEWVVKVYPKAPSTFLGF